MSTIEKSVSFRISEELLCIRLRLDPGVCSPRTSVLRKRQFFSTLIRFIGRTGVYSSTKRKLKTVRVCSCQVTLCIRGNRVDVPLCVTILCSVNFMMDKEWGCGAQVTGLIVYLRFQNQEDQLRLKRGTDDEKNVIV